jgi:ABC-type uncharacterized transport system involved in gliding motility auxiliary subunit
MISRRTYFWFALTLATLLFLGINIFANNYFTQTRLDLTQSGLYTLSPGTRAIVAKLPEPVTLRFYFSRKNSADIPATAAYAGRVRDLLGEYAAIAKGKIVLEDIDPEPYTNEQDQANAAKITPAPSASGGNPVYFGLEGINSLDNKEVIPYFAADGEASLEYDITSLLYRLSHPGKRKLAILSDVPLTAPAHPDQPLAIYAELQRDYDVTALPDNFDAIPDGTDVLMIVHPQQISAVQVKKIELFVVHGGRTLLLVDPISELLIEDKKSGVPPSSDFKLLLKSWGVDYTPLSVVLDRQLANHIADPNDPEHQVIDFPLWLHLTQDNFSSRDPVTANLQSLNLASVGVLTPIKGATTHFEPLITSSDQASLLSRDRTILSLNDPSSLNDDVTPTGKRYIIAARLYGKVVFPGVAESNAHLIVIADTDILDDKFWIQSDPQGGEPTPTADNEDFILNAMESLSGSDDLISLRTRGNVDHPFTVVQAMQSVAALKYRDMLQTLQGQLTTDQAQFAQLQQGAGGNATALTPEQSTEMDHVQLEMARTRAQLRDVQNGLHADIDRLGSVLAFINILLMPLLVAAFAIVFGVLRRRRAIRGRT